jgi:hypothetical protein
MDIVGFSSPGISAIEQAKIISTLNEIVLQSKVIRAAPDKDSLIMRSTGDGMVIGFPDSKEKPCRLAIEVQKKLATVRRKMSRTRKFDVRMGLHSGDVYPTKDIRGYQDVCGPGIILAQRVMDFGDAGHILASDKIAEDLLKLSPKYKSIIHPLNRYVAKHDEEIFIYNIYSKEIGNSQPPAPKTIGSISSVSEILETRAAVEVLDPSTFLTRVVVTRKFRNVGTAPVSTIYYRLILHSPATRRELWIRAHDGSGRAVKIAHVIQDTPLYKEFILGLNEPIQPGKETQLTHEFRWREPARRIDLDYMFKQSSKRLLVMDFVSSDSPLMRPRVYSTHTGTGKRTLESNKANVRAKAGRVILHWASSHLKPGHMYSLYW